MITLAEHIIVAGAENHPLILEKSMYDSWASLICLFNKGKKHGMMMLDSIDNGPLVYPTVEENRQTRPKKCSELTEVQQLQDDCDVQATNIILHGSSMYPPPQKFTPVYAASIHHQYHHTPVNPQQHSVSPQPFISPSVTQHSQADFPQLNSVLAIPTFQQGEDPIELINKEMAFLSNVESRFPPSKNQLRTSSNPRNQGIATTSRENHAAGRPRVVKCYNCQREGHMARQCQILDEEQLAFLADPGISEAPVAQQTILQNSAFQTKDLDVYDSNCDDLSSIKVALMTNLSSCDLDVLSEEIMHIAVNSVDSLDVNKSCVNDCNKCLELETELLKKKDLIKKDVYDELLKSYSTLEKHCISFELTTQLNQEIFQKDNFCENQNVPTFNQLLEINKLKAQLQEKDTVIRNLKDRIKSLNGKDNVDNVNKDIDDIETINIEIKCSTSRKGFCYSSIENELRKRKRKYVVDTAVSKPNATIAPGMLKLEIKPISHRLKNNRDAHEELLVYVFKTCPSLTKPCKKLVVVTLMNKDKKVRFTEPVTSSSNIFKQTDSLKIKDSNKPLLTSTGVKPTTSASGSKPSRNTKNNRITNSHVKYSVRNAKFESICAIYNKCLFDSNHDMCVIDYVNDVNVRAKSKSKSKQNKMRKVWKPTGKVFNEIGFSLTHTCRTFTIVGNRCPLNRITSTKVVPTKETSTNSVATPTQGILVYSRRPKATRSVGSSSKVKIVESKTSNFKEPKQSWGSTISNVLYSFLNDCRFLGTARFGNDHIAKIMGYGDYQMGNVTISWVYYVERPKAKDSVQEKLYLLHMDLCGPMRIQSINGRKYILVIVDDYSRFTWVKFLRSKDKVPEFIIKFLKMIQADAVAIACYTQNRSLIRKCHKKTPNELLHDRKLDLSYIHVFGALYYPTNDGEDLVIAPEPTVSTGTSSSTTNSQDTPSSSTSQTTLETSSPVIPLGVKEADHVIEIAHMDNNLIVDFPVLEPSFKESSTQSYKDALAESYWIKPMQEELNEFECLKVLGAGTLLGSCYDYYLEVNIKEVHQRNRRSNIVRQKRRQGHITADTLMMKKSKLDEDPQGKSVDPTRYLGMIDTIMYLTSSRPDIVFVVCMCARYQAKPTEKHLYAVKRIFRYLRGTINMGLW
nr:hypothetical protein [Tanacetum cinerariifolium]